MKAVILLASQSRNLHPFSSNFPKSLIEIAGKPLIVHLIEKLRQVQITDLVLVVGFNKQLIMDKLGYGEELGVHISYVTQESQKGIGQALSLTREYLKKEQRFMLLFGDILIGGNQLRKLMVTGNMDTSNNIAAIAHASTYGNFSYVYLKNEMHISKIASGDGVKGLRNYVLAGAFIFNCGIFDILRTGDIAAAYQTFIGENSLKGCVWEDNWLDVYYSWDLLKANRMSMEELHDIRISGSATVEESVKIGGTVFIDDGAYISSGSIIQGPCVIGKNAYIGNNCLIRKKCRNR